MSPPPFQVILQHELRGELITDLLASLSAGIASQQHALRLLCR